MRIALVSREYPPETAKGGLGTQTLAKACGMVARGHQVVVISRSVGGDRCESDQEGIRVIRIPGLDGRMPIQSEAVEWLSYSGEVATEVAAQHEREPLDLVDFPEWGGEGYIYLLNRADWDHMPPAVVQIHGPLAMFSRVLAWPEPDSDLHRVGIEMERVSLQRAARVYASSAYSAAVCASDYGLDRSRIPVIHTGIDSTRFHPEPARRSRSPVILFAGRITPSKGVLDLMEAASRLLPDFPDLRLRMVGRGDPPVLAEIRRRAQCQRLTGNLELPGFVDKAAMAEEYQAAHVFAAPSTCEGGPGFVYLEAMASGLPAIACRDTGVADIISDGDNGYLVRAGDPHAIEAALRRVFSNPSAAEQMGRRARRYALEEADTGVCLNRLEAFYAETVAGWRNARGASG